MKHLKLILVAAMAISLAGCLLSGKPKAAANPAPPKPAAPAPPPEPISIPQTNVQLPQEQTVDPKALQVATPVPQPAPQEETKSPTAAAPKPPGHSTTQPSKPAETTTPPPAEPEPAAASRPPIQEILPADLQKQYQDSAQKHKTETRSLLAAAQRRHLTTEQKRSVVTINQLVKQSDQAEANRDMRLADQLAERAYLLAKDLEGAK